jgi:hypothetical protein
MQMGQRIYSLAQRQNNLTMMVGACSTLAGPLYFMGEFEAARKHASRGVQLWFAKNTPPQVQKISAPEVLLNAPAVTCLCFKALCEWHLGKIDSCKRTMAGAVSLAKEMDNTYALTESLFFASMLGHFNRNPAEVERVASDLIELSTLRALPGRRRDFARLGVQPFR